MSLLILNTIIFVIQVNPLEELTSKNTVKEINQALAIFDSSWNSAIKLEGPLHLLYLKINNKKIKSEWDMSALQFATRLISDINVLKASKTGDFFIPQIQELEKILAGNSIFNELSSKSNSNEIAETVFAYEKSLGELKKHFGPASAIELLAFIKIENVKKFELLIGNSLSKNSKILKEKYDFYSKAGWEKNLILEIKILRILCEPHHNKTWENDYTSNINRLFHLFSQVYESNTQFYLDFYYYEIFLYYQKDDFKSACKTFKKIPNSWLIGGLKSNWLTIIKIYYLMSQCLSKIPENEEYSIDNLESAFFFTLTQYSKSSNFGKNILVKFATELKRKYLICNKKNSEIILTELLRDYEIPLPWEKLTLDQN